MDILVIIPARGGSKGIPRKNLRPLANKPLIHYGIQCATQSKYNPDVYLTSEDDEILYMAEKLGAKTYKRPEQLSGDDVTLDPVIFDAYQSIQKKEGKDYQLIITLQPTSPLLRTSTLDRAIQLMIENPETDTLLSAINDTHLTWTEENGDFQPNYTERLNRQYLKPVFKETGGFLITRNSIISENNRIGKNTQLMELSKREGIDIDSFEDWNLCEFYLKRKIILFCVSGYPEIGLGHIYNTLILAHEILDHRIIFLVDNKSEMGFSKIDSNNYEVHRQEQENIVDDIIKFQPHVVINDRLDTDKAYIKQLKSNGIKVVNIEDLGHGAEVADLVINAIYPEKEKLSGHYFGPEYFCIRDEFLLTKPITVNKEVKNVLVTFGGVDPNNLTYKVLKSISTYCEANHIEINVVTGLGYAHFDDLKEFKYAKVLPNVSNISDYMAKADIAFTSAGRTTYELASLGVPSIVLCQNDREATHFFASEEQGFVQLGLGKEVKQDKILEEFKNLANNIYLRRDMHNKMLSFDIRSGRQKVIKLIRDIIEETITSNHK